MKITQRVHGELMAARRWKRERAAKEPRPVLDADAIYLGDNGRAFCGSLHCAGQTAHFTGRDLSGQRVHRITQEDADYIVNVLRSRVPTCEGCGRAFDRKE